MAHANPLVGSGDHLFIDASTPTNPDMQVWALSNIVVNTSFDASWSNPALPAWRGTFSATGSVPGGQTSLVSTRIDFTTMPNQSLSSGTYFNFSDLDLISRDEAFTLRAYESSGTQLINDAWLNGVVGVSGFGSGPGGTPALLDMPSWEFANGEYTFTGTSPLGGFNPSLGVTLSSNQSISYLEIDRASNGAGFSLGAPVPTPGAISLLAMGGLTMTRRRRA